MNQSHSSCAYFLAVAILGACFAFSTWDRAVAVDIFRSTPPAPGAFGAAGWTGGVSVYSGQFLGARFEVTSTVQAGSIGGHFAGNLGNNRIFGAIVALTGPNDFPNSTNLSTPDVIAHALIPVFPTSERSAVNISATLSPGWYALVYGSGQFGATGDGAAPYSGAQEFTEIFRNTGSWQTQQNTSEYFLSTDVLPNTVTLIERDGPWKFRDNGTNQGTNWRMPGFSDSDWQSGTAEFGFGSSSQITATNNAAVTTYFRKQFEVANPAILNGLRLDLMWDDGAAVYLNGVEVFRNRLSANAGFSDFATSARDFVPARNFESFMIDPHLLVPGTNTIAVETHVASGQSDMSFNLRLVGSPVPEPATLSLVALAAGGWCLPRRRGAQ